MFFITHKINEMLCLEAKSFVGSTYLFCKDILLEWNVNFLNNHFFRMLYFENGKQTLCTIIRTDHLIISKTKM